MKRKRKTWRKKWTEKLDKLFSEKIRARDGRCLRCGRKKYLHAHHIISRSHRSLRWDLQNGICLCFSCHNWWHYNPIEAAEWVKETIGEERYRYLLSKREEYVGLMTEEKFKVIEETLLKS